MQNLIEPSSEIDVVLQPCNEIETNFDLIQQSLTKFKTNISDIQLQLRNLEKTIKKETKKKEATAKEPAVKSATREPVIKTATRQPKITGFSILEKITPELCSFMKLPAESSATRNDVTMYITDYINQQKLQDMTNRRNINMNDELLTLFKLMPDTPLTYFNLHKYISSLFVH
jgi:chromatin remodeling complex protein RSC6